jgi:thiol:disulfide interchange protein
MKQFFGSLIFLLSLVACNKKATTSTGGGNTPKPNIVFIEGAYHQALTKAQQSNKPVFIDFYAEWCKPCKWVEEDVFSDPEVFEYMNKHFVNLKLDIEKGDGIGISAEHGVKQLPTLLFIKPSGETLMMKVGTVSVSSFMDIAKQAERLHTAR